MTHLAWGQATGLILIALKALGSATARTVADESDLPYDAVRKALQRMAREPEGTRRVHILRWTYQGTDLEKPYLRAVYGIGPGRNASRPAPRPYNDVRRESAHRAHRMFMAAHPGIRQKQAVKLRAQISKRATQ